MLRRVTTCAGKADFCYNAYGQSNPWSNHATLNGLFELLAQAYGAKQYALVGHVWQRALIIMGLMCIPISVLLLFAEPILLATGQTATVAAMTASYIR